MPEFGAVDDPHELAVQRLKSTFAGRRRRTADALAADGFSTVLIIDRWVWNWLGFTCEAGLWHDGEWRPAAKADAITKCFEQDGSVGWTGHALPEAIQAFAARGVRDADATLRKVREIKDDLDLILLRRAAQHHAAALDSLTVTVAATSREVVQELERVLFGQGWEGTWSFDPSAPVDGQHSVDWYNPDATRVDSCGIVSVDSGIRLQGVCTDLTRIWVPGDISAEAKAAVQLVEGVMDELADGLRPGREARSVVSDAMSMITQADLQPAPGIAFGHGIGVEVHELPVLTSDSSAELREGMVVCVEPGVQLSSGWRIRSEGMFVVQDGGGGRLDLAK
ncbi:M24 family metallopeptidase [Kribbella sp. DT2]|uniref:M24 family metallopeptidase n=1 Tax=Kribbella sp. DT2 TaxID=3393427 RepID=UPI003CE947AD